VARLRFHARLGQLPPTGARFTALPLRIEATGTIPVRAAPAGTDVHRAGRPEQEIA